MRKRMKLSRPSHGTVVAYLALFVALGGSAYAVKQLPKKSVGTPQLKRGAVTKQKVRKNAIDGRRVKNNSLTGADIKLSKLGTVPSARNAAAANTANVANTANTANAANVANLANSIAPAEPTHLVGAPGEPAFEGGSSSYGEAVPGVAFQPVGFYKDHEGTVHLQGVAKVGSAGPLTKVFTLPPGYRPPNGTIFTQKVACAPAPGEPCEVDSAGDEEEYSSIIIAGSNVTFVATPISGAVISQGTRIVSLDGLTFRAES